MPPPPNPPSPSGWNRWEVAWAEPNPRQVGRAAARLCSHQMVSETPGLSRRCVCVCAPQLMDVFTLLIREGWECEGGEELCLQSGI